MRSNKKIWVIMIVILVVILLLGIGGAVLYFTTDFLKSDTQLFYQYAMKNIDMVNISNCKSVTDGEKLKNANPYTSKTDITFTSSDETMENTLKELKITAEGRTDAAKQKSIVDTKVIYKGGDLFKVSYLKDQDKFALKSDEIATAYVGIQNKDLQQLAKKIGATDVSAIPNQIDFDQFSTLFKIEENEKENIINTYSNILLKTIPKEKYTKTSKVSVKSNGTDYQANKYTLSLTQQDVANVQVALLNALKEDSVTLNMLVTKAKILGMGSQYTSVNELNKMIESEIDHISNVEYSNQEQIKISVYAANQKLLKTEILIVDQKMTTITYQKNGNKENTSIETIRLADENNGTYTFNIVKETTDANTNIKLTAITQMEENMTTVGINWLNNNTGSGITNTITITSQVGEASDVECNINQEIAFVDTMDGIPTLDNNNSAILNDYSQAQVQQLVTALGQRIGVVIGNKMVTVLGGTISNINMNTMSEQEVQQFNNQFTSFEGDNLVGANIKTLIDIIATANASGSNNKVILQLNGLEYSQVVEQKETIKSVIDTAKFYTVSFNYDTTSKLIHKVIVSVK